MEEERHNEEESGEISKKIGRESMEKGRREQLCTRRSKS